LELDDLAHPSSSIADERSGNPATVLGFSMRRAVLTLLAVVLLVPAEAAQADLKSSLTRYMRMSGSASGAYVLNLSNGERVFAWRAGTPRILASNTKLFTASAALARFGTEGTLGTEVLGDGELDEDGVWRGNLYLRGGGDPTFGSSTYTR
jgi:D-alanyl-D-alanine carboxypeptidase/D-alanyl-D-alanine-endopeptidase (penicillin-binding protein 4)